jgi:5-hydroxyisourate hydrolase-like protein (transthyretin family)
MKLTIVFLYCVVACLLLSLPKDVLAQSAAGLVVDPAGKPVAGATVYVFTWQNQNTPTVLTTDASGKFVATVSPQSGQNMGQDTTMCMIDAKGFPVSGGSLTATGDNKFQMTPSEAISGTVVDVKGQPVAGVSIAALSATISADNSGLGQFSYLALTPFKDRYTTKSDAKGNYSIANLPAGCAALLSLDDPAYVNAYVQVPKASLIAPPVTAQIGAVITGKVMGIDGKPVNGVGVTTQQAQNNGQWHLPANATTAADGTYKLTGLMAGDYYVTLNPSNILSTKPMDWAPPVPVKVTASIIAPTAAPDLQVIPGGLVTGLILDGKTKAPIPGASIYISDPNSNQNARNTSAQTDHQGRFTVRVWDGSAQLTVGSLPKPYANTASETPTTPITVTIGGTTTVPTMFFNYGTTATGKVRRDDGKPTGILQITIMKLMHQAQGGYMQQVGNQSTDANGAYTLSALAPGNYEVACSPPTDASGNATVAPPKPVDFVVSDGKPNVVPDLVLEQGTTVTGLIVDGITNQPVSGVMIGIQDPYLQGTQPRSVNATTDVHGRFTVVAWPGKLQFYVYNVPSQYVSNNDDIQHNITVVAGQALTVDTVKLKHAVTVAGTVVDTDGKPVPGLTLTAQSAEIGTWLNIPPISCDSTGAFTIQQLSPGSYYVDAGDVWTVVSPATFSVPTTVPLKIVLKKTVTTTMEGNVTDTNGETLAGVTVSFEMLHMLPNGSEMGSSPVNVTTDSDGRYTVTGVPLDANMVQRQSATKDSYLYRNGGDITKQNNRPEISTIVMSKLGGVVTGVVRNGLNKPVPDAWISCVGGGIDDIRPIQTDSTGSFKFSNVILGPVDIYATKNGYFGHASVGATSTPETTTLTLSVMPTPPAASDINDGKAMLTQLFSDIKPDANGKEWFYRDQCAKTLEEVSPTEGLAFVNTYTPVVSGDLNNVLPVQSTENPQAAAQWIIPLLQKTQDSGYTGCLAATVGLDVAPYNLDEATTLYNIAIQKISLNPVNQDTIGNAMALAALAYATKQPNADNVYQAVLKSIKASGTQSQWKMNQYAVTIARANVALALKMVADLAKNDQSYQLSLIANELVQSDPTDALSVYHMLEAQKDTNQGRWAYQSTVFDVLPCLFKTDQKGAIAVAEGMDDAQSRAEAVTIVADLLPFAQAKPLYEEAETESVDQSGLGTTPASIAAHAYIRDTDLGTELFKQAFDKVITNTTPNQNYGQGPCYDEFAFYYSRIDPGYSRLLIESNFAKDLINPSPWSNAGTGVQADVAAMAAIDPARANEMASEIKLTDTRFNARLQVAEYVLQSEQNRDVIPFAAWTPNDNWIPGVPAPW